MRDHEIVAAVLAWYDANARAMPWRVGPSDLVRGVVPDPYHVWMSEIMLQQTTVAAVRDYFERFLKRWPTITHLAAAPDADVMGEWAGLGYYARARNLLKCARFVVAEHDGKFPTLHTDLLKLPGIGPYTAAAISSIAFDVPEPVLDGNIERVLSRLFCVTDPLPKSKPQLNKLATRLTPNQRPGDYAQAMMDLGATICTPKSPRCGACPIADACAARAQGIQANLPKKLAKKPKPIRHGHAYVGRRADGAWLLERRPDKGLLGGMLGWPGSEWGDNPTPSPPMDANWRCIGGEVRHTFTHFHLVLSVLVAQVEAQPKNAALHYVSKADFRPSDLPTVMRKAYDLAAPDMGGTGPEILNNNGVTA